jgi:glyceraldehyde 3-phosphate dehydrogenase
MSVGFQSECEMIKVAINGFGRIGRSFLRALLADESARTADIQVVGINDLGSLQQLVHLLKYDSTLGPLKADISVAADKVQLNGISIHVSQERDPAKLPWKELEVDVVVEATGVMTDAHRARAHMEAGARKVLISAPAKNEDITIVYGVNEANYLPDTHDIVSNASCTTNCLAPLVKTIHDAIGIESGLMTTVHAYTQDQNLQDGPHKDLRRARSACTNIVPTSTGAAKAIGLVIPELSGRLDGYSVRVPVITGSLVDCTVQVARRTSVEEVNAIMREAAQVGLAGILRYTEEPLVSSDIIADPSSSIFDSQLTKVINDTTVKLVAWYDNEWGFSNRLIDTVRHIA